jgi:hypothetical protein
MIGIVNLTHQQNFQKYNYIKKAGESGLPGLKSHPAIKLLQNGISLISALWLAFLGNQ